MKWMRDVCEDFGPFILAWGCVGILGVCVVVCVFRMASCSERTLPRSTDTAAVKAGEERAE